MTSSVRVVPSPAPRCHRSDRGSPSPPPILLPPGELPPSRGAARPSDENSDAWPASRLVRGRAPCFALHRVAMVAGANGAFLHRGEAAGTALVLQCSRVRSLTAAGSLAPVFAAVTDRGMPEGRPVRRPTGVESVPGSIVSENEDEGLPEETGGSGAGAWRWQQGEKDSTTQLTR